MLCSESQNCAQTHCALILQNNFGLELRSSHAHELVATYFGYSSRAALLSDTKSPITNLKHAEFVVLTPTNKIKERRDKLNGLPQNLPDNLAEGIYLPLYTQNWIKRSIWPTMEELGKALADEHLKSKSAYFNDIKILRQGVQLEFDNEQVAIVVFREYISPSQLLSFQHGKKGVVDVFILKRIAGYIGYVKTNHISTEAETLHAATEKMWDIYHGLINNKLISKEHKQDTEPLPTFPDWLKKQKNRRSPLGDLAQKRGFSSRDEAIWPKYSNLEDYRVYLMGQHPPIGAMKAFENAWKSYQKYLLKKTSSYSIKKIKLTTQNKYDLRKIVFVKNIEPLHYFKRIMENFAKGDKAWVSWNGRKAIPITILDIDEMYYSFRVERPLKNAGDEYYVRLDVVGSTPELACINHVTF